MVKNKARSKEHERTREEYESRRSAILSSRNEKVTVNSLDSLDALDPDWIPWLPSILWNL